MKTKKKSSRSLMLEILDWLGFRLKLVAYSKRWQLVWKSNDYIVFFVRNYDAPPFRRYENCFPIEEKPKKPCNSYFAEFLGSVEMFELEDGEEAEVDITSPVGWLKNPLFGCKSMEEMKVKIDLLGESRMEKKKEKKEKKKEEKESYGSK